MRAGAVHAVVADAFVKRLAAQGLRLREYRVPHNGSVYCTVAPDDDLLITRLDAPLAGVERLDVELLGVEGAGRERLRDVPFDAAAGEVVLAARMERMRALPASTAADAAPCHGAVGRASRRRVHLSPHPSSAGRQPLSRGPSPARQNSERRYGA